MTDEQDNSMMICAAFCKMGMPEGDVETRFRHAAKEAHQYWASTDNELRFRGAVAALWQTCSDEELERVRATLDGLRKITAMLAAAQAGLGVTLPEEEDRAEPYPLMKWFHQEGAMR